MESKRKHCLVPVSALAALLSCLSLSFGLPAYGPYSLIPKIKTKTPSLCKVRDISLYGPGVVTVQATVEACIDNCKSLQMPHYTFSTLMSTCGCGNSTAGFTTSGVLNTGIVAGAVTACQRFPSCSKLVTVKDASQVCQCPTNTKCVKKKSNSFQCCCPTTFPIVFGKKLVGCSPNGA